MLANYFRVARRNLIRHRVYSFINVRGLAVGMAVARQTRFFTPFRMTSTAFGAAIEKG